jgi:hypothetical protein
MSPNKKHAYIIRNELYNAKRNLFLKRRKKNGTFLPCCSGWFVRILLLPKLFFHFFLEKVFMFVLPHSWPEGDRVPRWGSPLDATGA